MRDEFENELNKRMSAINDLLKNKNFCKFVDSIRSKLGFTEEEYWSERKAILLICANECYEIERDNPEMERTF